MISKLFTVVVLKYEVRRFPDDEDVDSRQVSESESEVLKFI